MAEVLRPRLEVYHPNKTGDFTLIDFPPTFIGTQRLELLVLRNFSAEMTPFVALAEINGEVKVPIFISELFSSQNFFFQNPNFCLLEYERSRENTRGF